MVLRLVIIVVLFILCSARVQDMPFVSVTLSHFLQKTKFSFVFCFHTIRHTNKDHCLFNHRVFTIMSERIFTVLPVLLQMSLGNYVVRVRVITVVKQDIQCAQVIGSYFNDDRVELSNQRREQV